MARKIDLDAIIERIRMEDQSTGFAGDPASGYSWLYTTTGGSPHGGLYLEKEGGALIGPFITGTTNTLLIYDDSVFKVTSAAISFDDNLDVVATGTTAFVEYKDIGARVYHSTGTLISDNTTTTLSFDSERYDTDEIHSGSSYQLYCNTAGKYLISANAYFAGHPDGYRQVVIRLNGTTPIAVQTNDNVGGAIAIAVSVSTVYDLNIGDYLEFRVLHTAGSDLAIVSQGNFSPEFMIQKIG